MKGTICTDLSGKTGIFPDDNGKFSYVASQGTTNIVPPNCGEYDCS